MNFLSNVFATCACNTALPSVHILQLYSYLWFAGSPFFTQERTAEWLTFPSACHIKKKQMHIYICLASYLWLKFLGTLLSNIQPQVYTGTWHKKDFLKKVRCSTLWQWVCPNNIQWQRCLGKWGTATKQHLGTLRKVCTEQMLLIRRYSPGIQESIDNRSYFT